MSLKKLRVREHLETTDDTCAEHVYSFSFCVFVRYIKGADYVHEYRRKMRYTKVAQGNVFM